MNAVYRKVALEINVHYHWNLINNRYLYEDRAHVSYIRIQIRKLWLSG